MVEEEVKSIELDNAIFEVVVKKLEDRKQWFKNGTDSIHHKTENICLNYDLDRFQIQHKLTEPEHIIAPRKYGRQIQKLVRNIVGFNINEKKLFALDYVNGMYPEYIDWDKIPNQHRDDFSEWLHDEVKKENFVERNTGYSSVIYFRRKADYAFMILKWF